MLCKRYFAQNCESVTNLISRERISKIATTDGHIMATFGNFHYLDFILNWVEHVNALGIDAYIVGAMDNELLKELHLNNVNAFSMQSNLTTSDFGWGSDTFHKMGRDKVDIMHAFVSMGFNIILSDVDTVWMRNPLEYFEIYQEADILVSSDCLATTSKQEELEIDDRSVQCMISIVHPRISCFYTKW